MGFLKVFAVLLVIGYAFAEEEKLPEACAVEDIPCFNKFNKEFLENIAGCVPRYGLKTIGALFPSFEMKIDGATADFTKLKVTGLKKDEIVDVKLAAKTMKIAVKENVKIEGGYDVTFPKKSGKYHGKYSATTEALLTATYNYVLKTNDKGLEHVHILSNTFDRCELTFINATRDEEFEKIINDDPELRKKYTDEKIEELEQATVCKILEKSVEILFDNFKLAAYWYPATDLCKDAYLA